MHESLKRYELAKERQRKSKEQISLDMIVKIEGKEQISLDMIVKT